MEDNKKYNLIQNEPGNDFKLDSGDNYTLKKQSVVVNFYFYFR